MKATVATRWLTLAGVLLVGGGGALWGCGGSGGGGGGGGPYTVVKDAQIVLSPSPTQIQMSNPQYSFDIQNDGEQELVITAIALGTVDVQCPAGETADPSEPTPSDAFTFDGEYPLPFRVVAVGDTADEDDEASAFGMRVRLAKQYNDECVRQVKLLVTVQNDPAYKDKPFEMVFTTTQTAPKLAVSPPAELTFGAPGECLSALVQQNIQISNTGTAPLEVDRICLEGDAEARDAGIFVVHVDLTADTATDPATGALQPVIGPGDLVASEGTACPHGVALDGLEGRPGPLVVAPLNSVLVPVTFVPDPERANLGATATVYFYANDADYLYTPDEATRRAPYELLLTANKDIPCLLVSPEEIQFPPSPAGFTHSRPLKLQNCGETPLTITGLQWSAESAASYGIEVEGGVTPSAEAPLVIPPDEDVTVDVLFAPAEPSPVGPDGEPIYETGTLVISNDSCLREWPVSVRGYGVEQTCPVAVIDCVEGDEVIPQTVLHLRGGDSFGAGGTGDIRRWEWTVEQPVGSQSVFVPSNTFPNPTFEANIAGTYTFHLTVWDASDVPSCEVASYIVQVVPDEAIHIELLWTTPGDADETDTGPYAGSDVDLHFMHPNAPSDPYAPDLDADGMPDPYFDQPWDAFWFNPHPDWGAFGDAQDDNPGLDRDDTDGAGPENINLNVPEENKRYRVAAHYWDDHGYGPAYATVRIYIYAELVFEVPNVNLVNHDLWCVAFVDWPSAQISMCQAPGAPSNYWITHGYQHPDFYNPGN